MAGEEPGRRRNVRSMDGRHRDFGVGKRVAWTVFVALYLHIMSRARKTKRQPPASPNTPQRRVRWQRDIAAVAIIVALGLVVYGRCVTFEHVRYDDPQIVFENPHVNTGLSVENVLHAFTTPNYGLYQPLPAISFMIDVELFGDWDGGYHLVTMLWHIACAVVVFLVFRRLLGNFPVAFAVALLFTVHPVQAMVLNWIVARNEIMPALFLMLSVAWYQGFAVKRSFAAGGASVFFMLLAILCKQTAVLLPVALLLLDYWPLKRIELTWRAPATLIRRVFWLTLEKIPWAVVSAVGVFFALYGKRDMFEVAERNTFETILNNMGGAFVSYARYLLHFLYPVRYVFSYPAAAEQPASGAVIILSAVILLTITALTLALCVRRPYLVVGWGWFGLMLLPVSGLVAFADEAIALRYLYVPAIGFYLIMAQALYDRAVPDAAQDAAEPNATHPGARFWGPVTAIVVVWALLAFWQSGFWRNTETLATRALAVTNNVNPVAHNYLSHIREAEGRMEEADEHARLAAENAPGVVGFQYNYAGTLLRQQRFQEAEELLAPLLPDHGDHASLLNRYAESLRGMGRMEKAQKYLEQALEHHPHHPTTLFNLAMLSAWREETEQAKHYLERLLQVRPDHERGRALLESLE